MFNVIFLLQIICTYYIKINSLNKNVVNQTMKEEEVY